MQKVLILVGDQIVEALVSTCKENKPNYITVDDRIWNAAIVARAVSEFGKDWTDSDFDWCQQELYREFHQALEEQLCLDLSQGWEFYVCESPTYKYGDF
jgi:hypothetical protein